MTRSLALHNIYVEGDDDVAILSLRRRLAALTPADQIEGVLDARCAKVVADIADWDGQQRWIHGKVLLESYLYPNVFGPVGCSLTRARDLLIETGRRHIPAEFRELAECWMT